VLDLGAAPGGWSIVAHDRVGPSGAVVAVDTRSVEPIEGVSFIRARVEDPQLISRLQGTPFDAVLADLSPRISGAYATDHARSIALTEAAFRVAEEVLAPGGNFVAKVFSGDLLEELESRLRPAFARLTRTKPPASRAHSSEVYLVGLGFRRAPSRAVRRP